VRNSGPGCAVVPQRATASIITRIIGTPRLVHDVLPTQSSGTILLTRSEFEELVAMKDALACVELAFNEHGNGVASNLTEIFTVAGKEVTVKAGYLGPEKIIGLKSLGLVLISRSENPFAPLAIIEHSLITWLRTAAAGAVAAKYLARPDSRKVGIIGTGKQGRAQLVGLNEVLKIESVKAWSPTKERREEYSREMSDKLGVDVEAVDTVQQAVEDRDVVVTATPSREPLVHDTWVSPGTHINAIGADLPGMQELSPALLQRGDIFADDTDQALRIGAVNVGVATGILSREDIRGTLGQVVAGKISGRTARDEITIFDCSGLGMMDVALAMNIYQKVMRNSRTSHRFF
jgi:alanine dehydrogenase